MKSAHRKSDKIYLLGFSRGAFTARSVGGLIASLGLLTKEAMEYFYYIFEDFENAGKTNYKVKLMAALPSFKLSKSETNFANVDEYLQDYKAQLMKVKLLTITRHY